MLIPLLAAVSLVLPRAAMAQSDPAPETSTPRAQLQVLAVNVSAQGDGILDVQFDLKVINKGSVDTTDVTISLPDGQEVTLGDVAADASASRVKQSQTIDVSEFRTRNYPLPVKVTFTVNGVKVDQSQMLLLDLAGEIGGGR